MGCVWAEFNSQHPDLKLMYNLKEFKAIFDPILENFLDQRVSEFLEKTNDPFIKDFINYSKKLTLSGGKRIRPYIAYIMYLANGGKEIEKALRLFVAFEIFHMFALMHDDVMDKQNKRHGVKTIHAYVLEKLKEDKRTGDLENVARAQGILLGDLFFSWALEIFLDNNYFPKENLEKAHDYFYKMIDEVCLGQILDIDTTTRDTLGKDLIFEKTILKTAKYTFVRPAQIGANLANPNNNLDEYSENLGTRLGFAFQLQDDLLDIIGDSDILEKNILRDIAEKQHTFFTNFVFENGSELQKEKLKNLFGRELNIKEQNEIINVFIESGAIAEGKKQIMQNLNDAKNIILHSNLSKDYVETCLDLIKLMENRQN